MEIEVIPFTLHDGHPARLGSLRAPLGGGVPQELALYLPTAAGLVPRVLHSTSWRHEADGVVLTYAAVLDPSPSLVVLARPLTGAQLARGTALAPPSRIEEEQVAAHALLHLAWLASHDLEVARALPGEWHDALRRWSPGDVPEELAV